MRTQDNKLDHEHALEKQDSDLTEDEDGEGKREDSNDNSGSDHDQDDVPDIRKFVPREDHLS